MGSYVIIYRRLEENVAVDWCLTWLSNAMENLRRKSIKQNKKKEAW